MAEHNYAWSGVMHFAPLGTTVSYPHGLRSRGRRYAALCGYRMPYSLCSAIASAVTCALCRSTKGWKKARRRQVEAYTPPHDLEDCPTCNLHPTLHDSECKRHGWRSRPL